MSDLTDIAMKPSAEAYELLSQGNYCGDPDCKGCQDNALRIDAFAQRARDRALEEFALQADEHCPADVASQFGKGALFEARALAALARALKSKEPTT